MSFWNLATTEPKRSFRYKVVFGGDLGQSTSTQGGDQQNVKSQITIFASKVSKPSYKVETKDFQYLNHKFNYPGRVTWEPVKLTFTDAGGSSGILDIAQMMMSIVTAAGYQIPEGTADLKTISKSIANKMAGQDGQVEIQQLNAAGGIIEHWRLYNAFFTDSTFSDLSYGTDELSTVDVTLMYDYAKLVTYKDGKEIGMLPPTPTRNT